MTKRAATKSAPKKRKSTKAKPAICEQTPAERREHQEAIQREHERLELYPICDRMREWIDVVGAFLESGEEKKGFQDYDSFLGVNAYLAELADRWTITDPAAFVILLHGLTPDRCKSAVETYNGMVIRAGREVRERFLWIDEQMQRPKLPPTYAMTKDRDPAGNGGDEAKGLFTFNPGQVMYEGKDLKLPTGLPVEVLHMLYDSSGQTVRHGDLHSQSTVSEASPELREAIRQIRNAIKKLDIPCRIHSKRGEGYVLK